MLSYLFKLSVYADYLESRICDRSFLLYKYKSVQRDQHFFILRSNGGLSAC